MELQLAGARSYATYSRDTGKLLSFKRGDWIPVETDLDWEWLTSGSGMVFNERPNLGPRLIGSSVSEQFDRDPAQRLLVCRGRGLGDVLLLIPALREWKRRYPESTVAVTVDRGYRHFFYGSQWVDQALDYRQAYESSPWDVVVNLNYYVEMSPQDEVLHRSVIFGQGLGLDDVGDLHLEYVVDDDDAAVARQLRSDRLGPIVVVQTHASTPTRAPSATKMYRLLRALQAAHCCVVALGSEVIPVPPGVVDLQGRCSLAVAAAVMQQADCVVGLDSGLTHIANALDCPIVALFGPGDPQLRVAGHPQCTALKLYEYGKCDGPCFDRRQKMCQYEPLCLQRYPEELVVDAVREKLCRQ